MYIITMYVYIMNRHVCTIHEKAHRSPALNAIILRLVRIILINILKRDIAAHLQFTTYLLKLPVMNLSDDNLLQDLEQQEIQTMLE